MDTSRLSRTTLEFVATTKAEGGRSGAEVRSPKPYNSKKTAQRENKSTLNTSIVNINQIINKIGSPELKTPGKDGQLLDHLRTYKNLDLKRQLSPHSVNFTLTNYG